MNEKLEEFWVVLCYSTKTQLALGLAIIFFFGILLLGEILVGGLQLTGPLAPLTEPLRDIFMNKYDKVAWMAFGSFLLLAAKSFRKDRRRILDI